MLCEKVRSTMGKESVAQSRQVELGIGTSNGVTESFVLKVKKVA